MDNEGTGTALSVAAPQQTQLSVYDRVDPLAFIAQFGKVYAMTKAGGCKTEQDGQLMALICLTERKTIFQIAKRYHLMDGKLVVKSEQMLSDFKKAGGQVEWINDGSDGQAASLKLTDWNKVTATYSFTIDRARKAGYIKDKSNWEKRPDQMLRARCVSDLMRMQWPEISDGDYTQDEIEDAINSGNVIVTTATTVTPKVEDSTSTTSAPATRGRKKAADTAAASAATTVTEPAKPAAVADETVIDAEIESPAPATAVPVVTASTVTEPVPFDNPNSTLSSEQAHTEQVQEMELALKITSGIRHLGWKHDDILRMVNGKKNTNCASFTEFDADTQKSLWGNMIATAQKNNIDLDNLVRTSPTP